MGGNLPDKVDDRDAAWQRAFVRALHSVTDNSARFTIPTKPDDAQIKKLLLEVAEFATASDVFWRDHPPVGS